MEHKTVIARDAAATQTDGDAASEPVHDGARLFITLLFNKYRGSLFRYLSGFMSSPEDADELVQESYARLIRRGGVTQVEAIARSYLFQTATNLARDRFRRSVTRRSNAHVNLDDLDVSDDLADPALALDWEQTIESLKEGIRELPPLTRRVFVLSRFRNKTYPEIAALLNISTRTVERRMSAAMQMLSARVGVKP